MSDILHGALKGERYRVIVTTDIGGSDPDDFQSMVHYLLYADMFDTEGLISSPWGEGRAKDIETVIEHYESDYENLKKYSPNYPEPEELRAITKQGAIETAPYKGYSSPTEGSKWIIQCAKKKDERPLYLLMWGLLEDLAQALHDAPEIAPKLRVHYIGGPNKKWGPNAYMYIKENFPDLWMIENNSSYRGWFNGGIQDGEWDNHGFVMAHADGRGALGNYFSTHLGGTIKMGDTPTVAWLLMGTPEHPEELSWGGSFQRVWDMPQKTHYGHPTLDDEIEVFGVLEIVLRGPEIETDRDKAVFFLQNGGQQFEGFYCGGGEYRIRFVPKEVKEWHYTIQSEIEELNGQCGAFRSVPERNESRNPSEKRLSHWWSDRLESDLAEGAHMGAKTVNRWRKDYLTDFAQRLARCADETEERNN